jgi:hypothetical protein
MQKARKFRMTREQALTLERVLSECGKLPRRDDMSSEEYQKFKYAVGGRNFAQMRSVNLQTNRMMEAVLESTEERMSELHDERVTLAKELGRVDENNQLILNDQGEITFEREQELEFDRRIKAIEARHMPAIEEMQARNEKREREILAKTVEVLLHPFPFSMLPETLIGGIMYDITPLLDGVPELEDDEDAEVIEFPASEK